MRRFAVGLPVREDTVGDFPALVADYAEHLAEVYFSWPGDPSGRIGGEGDAWEREQLIAGLSVAREHGLALDLLFNANCYGGQAVSRSLERHVLAVFAEVEAAVGEVGVVTTTSPVIARCFQREVPRVEVRASVNMRIRSPSAFAAVSGLFDSWYLCRDVQRDRRLVAEAVAWSHAQGKRLGVLANSGCLRDCAGRAFHDNLVAHVDEADEADRIPGWSPFVCAHTLRERDQWERVLQATWIRPEDLARHAEGVDVVKLATRLHERPRAVVEAYTQGAWAGNLLDLFEPTVAGALAPQVLRSSDLPGDWYERTSTCDGGCHRCSYCREALGVGLGGSNASSTTVRSGSEI